MINRAAKRARSFSLSPADRLIRDARPLGVDLSAADAERLLALTQELARWNRTYNLTAITAPEELLTHQLLDSLSVHADLHGTRIADVGTGAGFPGLPLALCNPGRQFTLIDSNGKKIRFVSHAAHLLALTNVTAVHARAETLKPAQPFDTVVTRAFAALPQLLPSIAALCGPETRVLAMKGRWPQQELAALPPPWHVVGSRQIEVPGLEAARCLIVLMR
jgi:16S rRNA (guanine527-N7)-methyltransferase